MHNSSMSYAPMLFIHSWLRWIVLVLGALAGEAGAAAACCVLITAVSTLATLIFMALGAWVDRSTQAWRRTTGR